MAGIGFELRKVVSRGGIGSFLQTAMSGAMIVAGPWLLSIITISLIRSISGYALAENIDLFMGVMIYSYAFSLFLFGGLHYLFTRRMSDLLYIKQEGQAFGYVLSLFIPIGLISAAIAVPAVLSFSLDIPHASTFQAASVLMFVTVNCLWLIMLFVSVLKWYIKIMLVYAAGLGVSILLIYLLSAPLGIAGAMLGFASGHLLIVILLIILCRAAWKPERPEPPKDISLYSEGRTAAGRLIVNFFRYAKKHRFLLGAGVFYYWGIWIDKIILWITNGIPIEGTFIRLFEIYDIPVYYSNLTMIPGLIFFVIYSETEFYIALKRFLLTLAKGRYADIWSTRKNLGSVTSTSLKEQCLLQGIVSLAAIIIFMGKPVLQTTLAAVFFHILLLTLLNYLFYIEQYSHACIAALIFFSVNALAVLVMVLPLPALLPEIPLIPGLSYGLSAAAASLTAGVMLKHDIRRLDRHILTK